MGLAVDTALPPCTQAGKWLAVAVTAPTPLKDPVTGLLGASYAARLQPTKPATASITGGPA